MAKRILLAGILTWTITLLSFVLSLVVPENLHEVFSSFTSSFFKITLFFHAWFFLILMWKSKFHGRC